MSTFLLNLLFLDFFDAGGAWGPAVYASLTCPVCAKQFSSRTSLADHRAVHEGRTFCTVCNKLCSTLANLRRHMKTHEQHILNVDPDPSSFL